MLNPKYRLVENECDEFFIQKRRYNGDYVTMYYNTNQFIYPSKGEARKEFNRIKDIEESKIKRDNVKTVVAEF